ncbi:MAG: hypothetical protein HDS56_07220 [Barnesiella sp.]|nr:hypothetical protein [Barnesiella sp.]
MFSKTRFKQSFGIICLITGIALYVIGYGFLDLNGVVSKIVINFADVLIIGVVVGYLSSVAQWAGIFKREIQDIVFGKEFIGERKDIETIWANVTKQLIKYRFSDIHKDLLPAIRANALPPDNIISYYEDHDSDITVEWVDRDNGIVKSIEAITFTLVADSDKQLPLPLKTTVIKGITQGQISNPEIIVDGMTPDIINNPPKTIGGNTEYSSTVYLEGKRQYCVSYKREKKYCINEDYFIGFRSQYILKNLTITLNLPEGIEATFIERGTNVRFDSVKNSKHCIKKKLRGVIFPKQGYIFALRVVPNQEQ